MRGSDHVHGTAKVLTCSEYRGEGETQPCVMHLVVQADGVPPTAVEHAELVPGGRWPERGMTLAVTVDRSDPRQVTIEWAGVPGAGGDVELTDHGDMDTRLDRLSKLTELRDQGVLTEAEFEAQKRRILER